MQIIKNFLVEDEGAEIAEYALLIVILALAVLAGAPTLKDGLQHALTGMGSKVDTKATDLDAA